MNKVEFNDLEKLIAINQISKDIDRHLLLISGNLRDIYSAFVTLGFNTSNLEAVVHEMNFSLKHIEYIQNIASFGTSGDTKVDNNFKEDIESYKLEDDILTTYTDKEK